MLKKLATGVLCYLGFRSSEGFLQAGTDLANRNGERAFNRQAWDSRRGGGSPLRQAGGGHLDEGVGVAGAEGLFQAGALGLGLLLLGTQSVGVGGQNQRGAQRQRQKSGNEVSGSHLVNLLI